MADRQRASYTILKPGIRQQQFAGACALAIMAKAPRPGKVKTRLQPPLTPQQAAALNTCFLRDTAENIASVSRHAKAFGLICYTPIGDEAAFDALLPPDFSLIAQRGGNFGDRLLCAAHDILSCGFNAVCLIDSDSPTMPASALHDAVEALSRPGDRIVLGPSADGGYYLIGMSRAHAAVFDRITWSTETVYAETLERVRETGLELHELPLWYDVDDAATLDLLKRELLHGERPAFASTAGFDARQTRSFLRELEP